MLGKIGQYDQKLDKVAISKILRLGLLYIYPSSIRFNLSEYGGTLDILYDNPSAMNEFNPESSEYIHLNEIGEKHNQINKIMRKYRFEINSTRAKKLYIAREKSLELLNFIFKYEKEVFIILQNIENGIKKDLKYLASILKYKKNHSNIIQINNPYEDTEYDQELYYRIAFRHNFLDIRLNSLLKKIIYGTLKSELYFISVTIPNIIVNIYDDRGMDVIAPVSTLKTIQENFKFWVEEKKGF